MDARRALLGGLFDDAGLFPPASLSLPAAVAAHRAARASANQWMLAGFVCPASLLDQLSAAVPAGEQSWRLSVILDAADAPHRMNAVDENRLRIAQTEGRPDAPVKDAIAALIERADGRPLFVEIPAGDTDAVAAVAAFDGAGVKVRCGGDAVPPADALARTIAACRDHGVRLKATAGLHHPFFGPGQHGFVNLAAAIVAAMNGADAVALTGILSAQGADAPALTAGGLVAGGVAFDAAECARRSQVLAGIGSCSFDEPVQDLTAAGILPL